MSKQNKVNPGTYTQAGRLTPDDTAREAKKQREVVPQKQEPNRVTKKDKARDDEESEDSVEE